MNWLINKLLDNGWVRFCLAFRWILGTENLFKKLVNKTDLKTIESRYTKIEQSGFFSGKNGETRQQSFLQALFTGNSWENNAIDQAFDSCRSWKKNPSVAPLEAFLNFIRLAFFQGPHLENNKKVFIKLMSTHNKNESNLLSRAAEVRVPESQPSPLSIVLNSLTDAGCFTTVENTEKLIQAICRVNHRGENALYKAFSSRYIFKPKNEDSCPNIKTLLDTLVKAGCFKGPNSETHKKTFIQAVLAKGEYGGVLAEAVWNPNSLQQILAYLTEAGCFANEKGIQAFFNALITPDRLGRTPLTHAAHIIESFNIIYKQLEHIGCLDNEQNKQKLINALFFRDNQGNSSLFNAARNKECTSLMLSLLTKLGCFEGPIGSPNQQAFIHALSAPNRYGQTAIYDSLNDKQLLDQLMKLKYFEGSFAEENNKAIVKAILAPTTIGSKPSENALSRHKNLSTFPILLEHLEKASLFSDPKLDSSKKTFLDSLFAIGWQGNSILSRIYSTDIFITLLQKMEKAGCFNDEEYKKQFPRVVRDNGSKMLFMVVGGFSSNYRESIDKYLIGKSFDLKGYLFDRHQNNLKAYVAFHRSLKLAGFTALDIKNLLNEPNQEGHTPLMVALSRKNDLLAARLIADGAELTEEQKQQVEALTAEPPKSKVPPLDREAIKEKLTKPASPHQPKITRRYSLSDLSLFNAKPSPSDATPKSATDDMDIGKSYRIRPS